MGFAVIAIEGFEVEVELTEGLRLEAGGLELNGDKAVEAAMEEQEVEGEVLAADLQRVLRADETEVVTELGEETAEVADQGGV